MNRQEWQKRLQGLQRKRRTAEKRLVTAQRIVDREKIHLAGLRFDIDDCKINVESAKEREKLSRKGMEYGK